MEEREGARVMMQSPSTTPLLSRSNGSAYEQKTSSSPSTPSSSATPVISKRKNQSSSCSHGDEGTLKIHRTGRHLKKESSGVRERVATDRERRGRTLVHLDSGLPLQIPERDGLQKGDGVLHERLRLQPGGVELLDRELWLDKVLSKSASRSCTLFLDRKTYGGGVKLQQPFVARRSLLQALNLGQLLRKRGQKRILSHGKQTM